MSKGRVFVTGATGFIGAPFIGALLDAGYKVRASVRSEIKYGDLKNLYPTAGDRLEYAVVADVTSLSGLKDALRNVDYVFHLAGPMVGKAAELSDYVDPPVKGTLAILEAANENKSVKQVVIMSSFVSLMPLGLAENPYHIKANTGVDLPVDLNVPFPEGLPGHFAKYQAGKTLAHQAARKWIKENNPSYPVVLICPSQIFGHSLVQKSAQDISGVNFLIWATIHGSDPPMTPYLMVDIRDVVDALAKIPSTDIPTGTELAITGPAYSWKKLAGFVNSKYPDLKLPFNPQSEPEVTMDTSATDKYLAIKWRPMEETIKSYLDQQILLQKA